MRGRGLAAGIALSAALLFGASQDKQDASADAKGKATFEKICTSCHDLDSVTTLRFTQTGWEQKVDDMVSRGATGTDEEFAAIVAYLTKHYGKIDINTATQPQLQEVVGFTEKESQAIVAYREQNGKIKDFEQLKTVPGLDAEKLPEKRKLIAFNP